MADEIDTRIMQSFMRDIAIRLNEAAVIARMVDDLGKKGLAERAFNSLLDIEPLIHEASIMLQASLVVRRRDRERKVDFD